MPPAEERHPEGEDPASHRLRHSQPAISSTREDVNIALLRSECFLCDQAHLDCCLDRCCDRTWLACMVIRHYMCFFMATVGTHPWAKSTSQRLSVVSNGKPTRYSKPSATYGYQPMTLTISIYVFGRVVASQARHATQRATLHKAERHSLQQLDRGQLFCQSFFQQD